MHCGKGKLCHLVLTLFCSGGGGTVGGHSKQFKAFGVQKENVLNKKNSSGSLVAL